MSDSFHALDALDALISKRQEYLPLLASEINGADVKDRLAQIRRDLALAGKRLARYHPQAEVFAGTIEQWAECRIENLIQSNAERLRPADDAALAKWRRDTIGQIIQHAKDITQTIVDERARLATGLDDVAPQSSVSLIPGGFWYGGKKTEIHGRPYQMLQALLKTRFLSKTVTQLIEDLGITDDSVSYPEQAIKDTAKKLRALLIEAAEKAGKPSENPLPSSGRGADLTYTLALS